jgi:hypothetical protein
MLSQKSQKKYECNLCNYKCSRKNDYDKHIMTRKHINTTKYNGITTKVATTLESSSPFTCICGKIYQHRASLYNHSKKCNNVGEKISENSNSICISNGSENSNSICISNGSENSNSICISNGSDSEMSLLKSLVIEVIKSNAGLHKQNNDLQKQVIELCKNIQPNNIITKNSNNIIKNSNNKTFNLQVFLNEECKDAMNITDFMNSFVLQIKDLENIGKLGYVDGISDIIVQKLKELDIKQRPMHCSDSKRETIYVKDEGIWEKEGPSNNKVKKVVGHVSKHNLNLLNSWKDLHPCCLNSNSPHNGHYLHLIKESLGGPNDMDLTESKIVKKISKEITIDKKD